MKRSFTYYFGNTLILLSLTGFAVLFYPLITSYFFPAAMPVEATSEKMLWIPKIRASGKIIPGVDPWHEAGYKDALKHGIALAKGFAEPGQHGTLYLFAHSSGMPWELTRYNSVFLRLGELQENDQIIIWWNSKTYTYRVVGKKEVLPQEVQAVTASKEDQLILQTCTPLGTDWKRLLIFAKEVKE